jgi:hypothetical protein
MIRTLIELCGIKEFSAEKLFKSRSPPAVGNQIALVGL